MILGITDSHDSGVAICAKRKVEFAINEERLTRKKLYTGWPKLSIEFVLKRYNIEDIQAIALADYGSTTFPSRILTKMNDWLHNSLNSRWRPNNFFVNYYRKCLLNMKPTNPIIRVYSNYIKKKIEKKFKKKVYYVHHHDAHAAGAYFSSGFKKALVITADGSGDGISCSVSIGENGKLTRISETLAKHSAGKFYSKGVLLAGLKRNDAGKLFGLATYHKNDFTNKLNGLLEVNNLKLESSHANYSFDKSMKILKKMFKDVSREDIAFAFQNKLELILTKWVQNAVEETGIRKVVVSGGVFGNVKLNKRISELDCVKKLFVFPGMSDCGLGFGASVYINSILNGMNPYKLKDVYLGSEYEEETIEKEIKKSKLKYEKFSNIEEVAADFISKGKVVGWFQGRMEFGPRALGNRSVLACPKDVKMKDHINKILKKRDWFMPFAPSIIKSDADEYIINNHKADHCAKFMTIAFDCKEKFIEEAPAAMAVDKTARPQLVDESNLKYLNLLKRYKKITGSSVILNTSFNIHGDPIVCSPKDAIETFKRGGVEVLIIGNFLIKN